jgi:hypothetical protein
MIPYRRFHANRSEAASTAFHSRRRAKSVVAGAVRMLNLTVADALYAYAVTGSILSTLMLLAAPHLEVFVRCVFHGKG